MTDPADCGPVCLAFCQDVQAEAYDYPESFFEPRVWRIRRPEPDPVEVAEVVAAIRAAKAPVIVAGGGVLYSGADDLLADFAARRNIPVVETQAGKGATGWEHPMNFGSPGVTGSACGNEACAAADLVIGVGTRFQDFTTGSWTVFANPERRLVSINVHGYDALKHGAIGVVGDAKVTLEKIDAALGETRFAAADAKARTDWHATVAEVTAAPPKDTNALPSDAQVIGAVQRVATGNTIAMCAAGTMPGALQVLWQAAKGGYHMEYGYSCMGYEVAGAMGIKLAEPVEGGDLLRRRRLLHDGQLRTRHRGDAARALHHRADRQPRLRLHQPAAAGVRRRRVQQHVQGLATSRRSPRSTSSPTPPRWAPMPRRPPTSPTSRRGSSPPAAATSRR